MTPLDALQAGALLTAAVCLVAQGVREVLRESATRRSRRRARNLLGTPAPPPRKVRAELPPWVALWVVPVVAAGLGWALFGGIAGLGAGVLATCGVRGRLPGRRKPPGPDGDEEEAARHLPLAADLLAACVASGASPGEAVEAVGRSLGGPLGERLARTAAELRLGGEPAEVWRRFGAIPGAMGLARCLERAGSSGAPSAEAVARHATALRAARARTAAAGARRAQVLISAPVGLCFLPAFLAVGVAPVVIGLATGLLKG
ncbi:type II secretion system F family protein [Streptomyces sp. SID5770]|uniref:type II secretion system F family protein n=1 Tax=Streptomyces sp. SID5770 TaxID=2690308 RepID=UPI0031BAECC1